MCRRHVLRIAGAASLACLVWIAGCTTRNPAASADAGVRDGASGDAAGGTRDGGVRDAAGRDALFPCDTAADDDRDTIRNGDEGCRSRRDTDKDGIPDYLDQDSDDDGITDKVEAGDASPATPPVDSDKDGTPDFQDTDSDGNGVPDKTEGTSDLDGDGLANYADADNDNDGITDKVEVGRDPRRPADSDKDGIPDYNDTDSDGNGIADKVEGAADRDKDGTGDYADMDNDGDKLTDREEIGTDPAKPTDFDKDGTPDYNDIDSDNDGIGDLYEGRGDADGDKLPNRHDLDADGDGYPDATEKGAAYPPPVDSDRDKTPDFLDKDSDNDGIVDATEKALGTSPTKMDTDGDGAPDFLETRDPRWDARDPKKGPRATGDLVFISGDRLPPVPATGTVSFATGTRQGDVVFLIDTTGSMGGEIGNLRASLASIVTKTKSVLRNAAFGVARYEDFPTSPYGARTNVPFALLHRVMTVATAAGFASVKAKVDALRAAGGADIAEAGWEALYQLATGKGVKAGGATVPPFAAATAFPAKPPAGEAVGTRGGAGFRKDALPIVIWATDAPNHDPKGYAPYKFTGAATAASALAAAKALGMKVIGVLSGTQAQARADLLRAADETGASVRPADFGSGSARPSGCAATQCCTGIDGRGVAPDKKGRCPLVFAISSTGKGLGSSVESGIRAIASVANVDVSARVADAPGDKVDAVKAFIKEVRVRNVTSASPRCTGGLTVADLDPKGDGVNDTFVKARAGASLCFDVVPKLNATVRALTDKPLLFKAVLTIYASHKTALESRSVWFVVPARP